MRPDVATYSPTILSLATGYGGIELGVELLFPGARTVCYVEREGYAAANLVARFQDETMVEAPIWDDVATFDGKPWRKKVDWIVGGYPCQPFSVAGKRAGTKDFRHLWPEFARIISEVSPAICFFENVSNHLKLGFFEVARDLQRLGFTIATTLVTAEEVGAPHRRERLFTLAVKHPTECRDAQSHELAEALADAAGLFFAEFTTTGPSGVGHIGEELAHTEHAGRREVVSECNPAREFDDYRDGEKDAGGALIRGEKLAGHPRR